MDDSRHSSQLIHELHKLRKLPDGVRVVLRHGSTSKYLDTLAILALELRYTTLIYAAHEDLFTEISSRWLLSSEIDPVIALAAYACLLPSAPHLVEHATILLNRRQSGILSTMASRDVAALRNLPNDILQMFLLAICRLLMFDNAIFAAWVSPAQLQMLLIHEQRHIRYLAIKILCLYLYASDTVFESMIRINLGEGEIEGPWDEKTIDYTFFSLWEQRRLKDFEQHVRKIQAQFDIKPGSLAYLPKSTSLHAEDLSANTAYIGDVLVPCNQSMRPAPSSIVRTETTMKNLKRLGEGVNAGRPLMVTGLPGAGKTKLIREAARMVGKDSSMVTLHLNAQTDAKLLVGMYTSAQTPSSFAWRPGVLTTAVMEGRWVLIEDLDRAPMEVVSTLLPLIERQQLLIPNWGESIRAAPGFKLIVSVRLTIDSRGQTTNPVANMLGLGKWLQVPLQMPSDAELSKITASLFPLMSGHLPRMMKVYAAMKDQARISNTRSRSIGPQDLLRWSRRVQSLLHAAGAISNTQPISEFTNNDIFLEAVDCFAGSLPTGFTKAQIIDLIAQELHIPTKYAEHVLEVRRPAYQTSDMLLRAGRAINSVSNRLVGSITVQFRGHSAFAMTDHVLRVLESLAVSVQHAEPCLLVGETGTGKTTTVQYLATTMGHNLTVVNLSQQSEVGDLLGGYKPVSLTSLAVPMMEELENLLQLTIPSQRNLKFRNALAKAVAKRQWTRVSTLWEEALRTIEQTITAVSAVQEISSDEPRQKKRKMQSHHQSLKTRWTRFAANVKKFQMHVSSGSKGFAFSFVEGNIIKAARNGDWVLLDEINLASPDTLEGLADLISHDQDTQPSLLLSETGDLERILAHKDFRIFGAMNPATDIGKRDLPPSIRSKFTEIFVDAPDTNLADLVAVVKTYLGNHCQSDVRFTTDIANLYLEIQKLTQLNKLVDGANQKPHFSLRTLTRTLVYVNEIAPVYGLRRSLFEGFSMSFSTCLNAESRSLLQPVLERYTLGSQKNIKATMNQKPRVPDDGKPYVRFRHYWVPQGCHAIEEQPHYIITPFVEQNLLNLVRATSTRRFPVLLQGPTSSGKTSMVEYLARISGNHFVRVNNHEHTDLQEYLGAYVSSSDGRLEHQDGVLVKALKEGHWIVLDELNLAPTDILEALNRLLDDNRELLIPETQQVIRPHNNFMLFATQNPPGLYGGRKTLSRAFRNRFLELHFDEIPEDDLETILRERSQIAPSFCARIVAVYKMLSTLRQTERLFEQENSFATLRDLFRWALRDADDRQQLAINGFMLLGERVRNEPERMIVKRAIEEVMKVNINENQAYSSFFLESTSDSSVQDPHGVIWTQSMRRLYVLVAQALKNKEPVLLVGETGSGKTTICQVIANLMKTDLHIVNAHQNMETGDLIGAQRPLRNRVVAKVHLIQELTDALKTCHAYKDEFANDEQMLATAYNDLLRRKTPLLTPETQSRIERSKACVSALFEWSDGSLVTAMRNGHHFLLDEISLADDSVLERLNSVLEPNRTMYLAEKGSVDATISASDGFRFLATMNPGGDYGKRELSPALRNRFTEIWVPLLSNEDEVFEIVVAKLDPRHKNTARPMIDFAAWFTNTYEPSMSVVSLRDLLAWITFVNGYGKTDTSFALFHGACMVFLDRLGASPAAKAFIADENVHRERQLCISKLEEIFGRDFLPLYRRKAELMHHGNQLIIGSFQHTAKSSAKYSSRYSLRAPTTLNNAMKVFRAFQSRKPILLEGSPGVGKTTLVAALAERVGMPLTRINLSDQTDLMDLFGSDIPIEGDGVGQFGWRDAPFLRAMQRGEWVLLDEMNLASQAVLEGLNACFDHRGKVYVSELDRNFSKHPDFIVFAAQNPHHQGGGRKGLPASFVNRFTVVYADTFTTEDLRVICSEAFPQSDSGTIQPLIHCISDINMFLQRNPQLNSNGGPWEINLRDILRWIHLIHSPSRFLPTNHPAEYQEVLFVQRFRTAEDRLAIADVIKQNFADTVQDSSYFAGKSSRSVEVGLGLLPRAVVSHPASTRTLRPHLELPIVESIMLCVEQKWPTLLVGSAGSGKTSTILHLASLTGADVVELCLNPDMDTTDLVGGFEQLDRIRELTNFVRRLREYTRQVISQQLGLGIAVEDLLLGLESSLTTSIAASNMLSKLQSLARIHSSSHYPAFLAECQHLSQQTANDNRACFEWVDSMLVRALKQGKWLVLDNANLCNPSVLDRLNSLLEPDGCLSINEHCDANGNARLVKPHPNFRLFITMDPRHGELSRAMRNRSVELFMPARIMSNTCRVIDPAIEPSTSRFAMFQAFDWDQPDNARSICLMSICFDHLSVGDRDLLQLWQTQVLNGMNDLPLSLQAHLKLMVKVYHDLCSFDGVTMKAIQNTYALITSKVSSEVDLGALQTIHPFNNPLLIPPTACNPWSTNLSMLGQSLDLLLGIHTFCQEITRIAEAVKNKSPSEMSRLERSFASHYDRRFRNDTTQPIANFLEDMGLTLRHFVDGKDFGDIEDRRDMLSFAKDTLQYLNDILRLAQSSEFEESTFTIYRLVGESMAAQHNVQGSPEDMLAMLARELASKLKMFSTIWQLFSGFRMEVLWKTFKPPTAHDSVQLQSSLEVGVLADRFDEVKWASGASLPELSNVQRSINDVYENIQQLEMTPQDSLDVHESLQTLTRRSLQMSSGNGPYFTLPFDCLKQYESTEVQEQLKIGSLLGILSGERTRLWFDMGRSSKAWNLLQRLPRFMGTVDQQGELAAIRRIMPVSIFDRLAHMSDVPLRSLDLLLTEIGILAETTARFSTSVTSLPLRDMRRELRRLHDVISEAFHECIAEDLREIRQYVACLQYRLDGKTIGHCILEQQTPCERSRSEHLFMAIQSVILPFREVEDSTMEANPEMIMQVARYTIQLFTGFLLLYVPDRPLDPALRPKIERDRYRQRCSELRNKLGALQDFEKATSGQLTNYRIKLVEQDLQALGDVPQSDPIFRPEISKFGQLHEEFVNVLRSVVLASPDILLLDAALAGIRTSIAELELRRRDIVTAISRLSQGYQAYDDIVKPLIAMLRGLDSGLALALLASVNPTPADRTIRDLSSSTPFMDVAGFDPSILSVQNFQHSGTTDHDLRLHSLNVAALIKDVEQRIPPAIAQATCHIFHTYYDEWKEQLHHDQQEAAAKTSLYRHRGGEEDSGEADEREFRCLFPDYEHPQDQRDDMTKSVNMNSSKRACQLAGLQREVLGKPREPTEQMVHLLKTTSKDIAHLWSHQSDREIFPVTVESMLPALFSSLDEHNAQLRKSSNDTKSYSFYTDANISEARKLVALVRQTQTRFLGIQEAWPEHATLGDVLLTCSELLAMRHIDPIAKLLTKAEQLHAFINEWQVIASKDFSVAIQYDQLTQLLVSWRRLELSTWARLLDSEDKGCSEDADVWWFIAYETIIAAPLSILDVHENLAEYTPQLFSTLEDFLATTAVGQYSSRLGMVQMFQRHTALLTEQYPALSLVGNALSNFASYYRRFEPTVLEKLREGRRNLEKEIKEILLLANWKDTNINALRDSAKRSHHKLFKIVRKYRALLAQPVRSTLAGRIPDSLGVELMLMPNSGDDDLAKADPRAVDICQGNIKDWSSKPPRLKNVDATAQSMLRMSQLPLSTIDGAKDLTTYAQGLSDHIKVLQKETPPTASTENAEVFKQLKAQKRKLYSDTLKDLRQMGFRSNLNVDLLAQQGSTAIIMAKTPPFDNFGAFPELADAETEIQGFLHTMPQVREILREHHDDLNNAEIVRSAGYLESILATLLTQRRMLAGVFSELASLEETQRRLANTWAPDAYQLKTIDNGQLLVNGNLKAIRWLPSILNTGAVIIEKYSKLGGVDNSTILDAVQCQKSRFEEINEAHENFPILPDGLFCSLHAQEYVKDHIAINGLEKQVEAWIEDYPHLAFVFKQIEPWARVDVDWRSQQSNDVTSIGLRQFQTSLSQALDSILVAIQGMQSPLASLPVSAKDPKWLLQLDAGLTKSIKKLRIDTVHQMLDQPLKQMHHLDPDSEGGLGSAGALCAVALPIVQQYCRIVKTALKRYALLHLSLCKLATVLSKSLIQIGREGFCSPAKSSKEAEQTEKLEGGTGLGEGQGAEDISKDVRDDEDLSDLAQEGQQEKSEDPIVDQEHAVDMDHDKLEGEVVDVSDKGDDEVSGEEPGDSDLEDQTGDVDDLDPTAVDEKLWDGRDDEAQEENEGLEGISRSSRDEQVTGGSDEQAKDEEDVKSDDGDDSSQQGVDGEEAVAREETENMDPHAQEGQNLDLPEEIDFDNMDGIASESDSDADEMNRLSDVDDTQVSQDDDFGRDEKVGEGSDDSRDGEFGDDEGAMQNQEGGADEAEAESPVNDTLDDVEKPQDGLETHLNHTDDANIDSDNAFGSDVRGLGNSNDHQAQGDGELESASHREQGTTGDFSDQPAKPAQGAGGQRSDRHDQPSGTTTEEIPTTTDLQRQAFKRLGDALEKWHRQQRQIIDAPEQSQERQEDSMDVDLYEKDLEHLPEDGSRGEGQALGSADNELAQALEGKAFESEMPPDSRAFPPVAADDESLEREDEDMQNVNNNIPEARSGKEIGSATLFTNSTYQESTNMSNNKSAEEEEEDIDNLDKELSITHLQSNDASATRFADDARQRWAHYENTTRDLSLYLTEQLRLILAPTLATKMRGDFRTGKRLNMKRIIPYIASQYKKDKIWMRRSIPSKRKYQIMLSVDDSKSMGESGSGQLAFETLALVAKSLSMLEVGQICVVGFGTEVVVAHDFDEPFTTETGASILNNFGFQQSSTDIRKLVAESIRLFREARRNSFNAGADLWQLELIISDGICEDHDSIRRLVRQAQEERLMIVFIIVDTLHHGSSIMDMSQAVFEPDAGGETKLRVKRYLDGFPFLYYLVVGDVKELPAVLAQALRQWFSEVVGYS